MKEKYMNDAPAWYDADSASGWAAGYNEAREDFKAFISLALNEQPNGQMHSLSEASVKSFAVQLLKEMED